MADVVTSQTLINGARNLVMKFTNESDGTGEADVLKVDATSSTFNTPGVHLKVVRVTFAVVGGNVRMRWDANTDVDMAILGGAGTFDWTYFGGLYTPTVAGATGSIRFSTAGFANNSSYTVTLEMIKGVQTIVG